ncbi:MAG TPA: nitroreductase family protein [Lachnospiraceae bacterium]|nr:nitroreductase family protein [Lachnospiraceae bacterium]
MNVNECILGRGSIRKFSPKPIETSIIKEIIEEASYSPSWKHTQIVRYVAVMDQDVKYKIGKTATTIYPNNGLIIQDAAALIAVTIIKKRSGYERDGSFSTIREDGWQMFDAGIASQTLCLAAYEHGLGSVILGLFDVDTVSQMLNIPEDQDVIALIPIGYPEESPIAPKRKCVDDLLTII